MFLQALPDPAQKIVSEQSDEARWWYLPEIDCLQGAKKMPRGSKALVARKDIVSDLLGAQVAVVEFTVEFAGRRQISAIAARRRPVWPSSFR